MTIMVAGVRSMCVPPYQNADCLAGHRPGSAAGWMSPEGTPPVPEPRRLRALAAGSCDTGKVSASWSRMAGTITKAAQGARC